MLDLPVVAAKPSPIPSGPMRRRGAKYADDQPRDEMGRWSDDGGGGAVATAVRPPPVNPLLRFTGATVNTALAEAMFERDSPTEHHNGREFGPGAHRVYEEIPGPDAPSVVAQIDRVAQSIENLAFTHGVEADEIALAVRDTMEAVIADASVAIRVPSTLLGEVLGDGFENQFESRSSGGMFEPEFRAAFEWQVFGVDTEAPPDDHPIYGYLTWDKDPGDVFQSVGQYGDVRVTLKDEVMERATFTIGDSLSDTPDPFPTPLLDPSPIAAPSHYVGQMVRGLEDGDANSLGPYDEKQLTRPGYWETQVHGGVTADDIARVDFSGSAPLETWARNVEALDARGIEWGATPVALEEFIATLERYEIEPPKGVVGEDIIRAGVEAWRAEAKADEADGRPMPQDEEVPWSAD